MPVVTLQNGEQHQFDKVQFKHEKVFAYEVDPHAPDHVDGDVVAVFPESSVLRADVEDGDEFVKLKKDGEYDRYTIES